MTYNYLLLLETELNNPAHYQKTVNAVSEPHARDQIPSSVK
jgi:hypothetical protein